MARGRMLDRRFMESKKLQSVPRDARLAYASILPFLDREGRIIAEPTYLKAIVFRHSDFTLEEIGAAVRELADAGLVELYADEDNAAIIQYVDFKRFNSPNAKESKSDLPGPNDDGARACTDPLVCTPESNAPAMHVHSTGSASGERNVNGTGTSTINVNPPYPPTPTTPQPSTWPEDDAEEAKRAAQSRQARNHSHHVLMHDHPDVWRRLGELASTYDWKPQQHRKVAEKILDLARDHTPGKVIAAIDKVLLNAHQVKWPIAFVEKVLQQDATAPPGSPTPLHTDDELDRMFGLN